MRTLSPPCHNHMATSRPSAIERVTFPILSGMSSPVDSASNLRAIGDRVNSVGNALGHHGNHIAPARSVMKRLRDVTLEIVNLGFVLDGETITQAQTERRAILPPEDAFQFKALEWARQLLRIGLMMRLRT